MQRNGLIRAAACAALACAGLGGLARADVAAGPAAPAQASALSLRPVYLDDAPARTPLMALLDKAGVGKALDDAHVRIGGLVEGSYTYSASNPPGNAITGRLFDFEHEDPTLNQVQLFAERTVDEALAKGDFDIGARVEFMYGADARFIHGLGLFDHRGFFNVPAPDAAGDTQFDLTQAYADIAVPLGNGKGLKLRVGKFVTLAGQEVIDPSGNAFYSHGFLFNYAIPLTHTGVLGTYVINDQLTIDAGVTRGWDTALEDDNDTIDYIARLTVAIDPNTKLLATVITGADQPGNNDRWRTLIDVILTTKIGDNLTLALNGDYAYESGSLSAVTPGDNAQWYGLAAYAGYAIDPHVTANLRGEFFTDDDGARLTGGVGGASVFELTAGVSITPFAESALGKNFVVRPEVRVDYATKGFFDGGTDRYQFTAAVDAIYKF